MGQLYDAKVKVEKIIAERRLNESEIKGTLSLRTGFLLSFVLQDTPDDPVKLEKLRAAVRTLLKAEI